MARQSTTPVAFNRTIRKDEGVLMSSERAGVVVPCAYIPLLPGDSASGKVGIDVQLKEMPKPLLNAAHVNFQAWFVPKSASPVFSGRDELLHAMTGHAITALGQADRAAPKFFTQLSAASTATALESRFFKALGIHMPTGQRLNTDLLDAFGIIYNFRLAAHSSKLARRKYATEDIIEATSLPPAFWPSSRFSRVVADYDRALIVGSLDLDVVAGRLPVSGLGLTHLDTVTTQDTAMARFTTTGATPVASKGILVGENKGDRHILVQTIANSGITLPQIFAEMKGQRVGITLADIDKARTTQAFAKLRSAYAGNDATGFDNDDTLVALLMQGIAVPSDEFARPWLLDSQRVPVGFAERFATDGTNLDKSVTLGRASAQLSLNVPKQDVSGVIIVTCEVLPERIDERQGDDWLGYGSFSDLPNALRDVQRVEPVDMVFNRRIDAKHTQPNGLYGYEPMNDKWNRDFTRLGGDFYMATPGGGWTENRSAIWQTELVDPTFSKTHYLAPSPFPHDVFADQNGHAFEIVCRHQVAISGITQIGDPLVEDNGDFVAVDALNP